MPVTAALRCERVSFGYGVRPVLRDVSFTVAPGERVALVGPNGAGKTTLIRLITGLARAGSGTVWVGDWDAGARRPEELARRAGVVFQYADRQLFGRAVRDDVAFGPLALGLPRSAVAARVEAALADLGLTGVADEHPYDLTSPLRRLVAIAGALALAPSLLLLDEPTAGLDHDMRGRVARVIRDRAAAGCAVVAATHDLGFAAEVLDRALALGDGQLVFDDRAADLCRDPARIRSLGLREPPVAMLSRVLRLPGRPVRVSDAASIVAECCAIGGRSYIGDAHGQT